MKHIGDSPRFQFNLYYHTTLLLLLFLGADPIVAFLTGPIIDPQQQQQQQSCSFCRQEDYSNIRNKNKGMTTIRDTNRNRFRSKTRTTTTTSQQQQQPLRLGLGATEQLVWDSQLAFDVVVATALSVMTDPLIQFYDSHQNGEQQQQQEFEQQQQQQQQQQEFEQQQQQRLQLKKPFIYAAAKSIPVAARVYASLSIINWILIQPSFQELLLLRFLPPPFVLQLRQESLQVALTIWLARTASITKHVALKQAISGTRLGRVALYDKLVDALLVIAALAIVLHELDIDYGMRLQSIFAAGSLGAITFSLASRDLAENMVGGVVLQAWDAFHEGDDIRLGDGSEGTVLKIGLVETELCGYDNIVTMIPNAQLTKERVSNMSRMTRSRFKQALRFQYKDIDKVTKILDDVLEAIRSTCSPSLITDGSKPFQAVLTKYEPDHIEAQVTCHFTVPPGSGDYVMLRQAVLLAIAKAMQINQAEFALPSINYRVDDTTGGQNSIL